MTEQKTEQSDHDTLIIDGFTFEELVRMGIDAIAQARCEDCGEYSNVEPDARKYTCPSCGALESLTSPLVKLGLL